MGGSPENAADILKNRMKVEIFCIGITDDVRVDALYKIASTSIHDNEERINVFILKNYEILSWLIQDIFYRKIGKIVCYFLIFIHLHYTWRNNVVQ